MAWGALVLAGLFEMFGVAMINKLHQDRSWQALALLFGGFGASFIFLSYAMETLPMGTAYAVWTGIGASGGAILGMSPCPFPFVRHTHGIGLQWPVSSE